MIKRTSIATATVSLLSALLITTEDDPGPTSTPPEETALAAATTAPESPEHEFNARLATWLQENGDVYSTAEITSPSSAEVILTAGGRSRDTSLLTSTPGMTVSIRYSGTMTQDQMTQHQLAAMSATGSEYTESHPDSGIIDVYVPHADNALHGTLSATTSLQAEGLSIRVIEDPTVTTQPEHSFRGGGALNDGNCTAGWAIKNLLGSRHGIVTADHCTGMSRSTCSPGGILPGYGAFLAI